MKHAGCSLILCLTFFSISCAGPKAVECAPVEIRVEKVTEQVIVPVPDYMTPTIERPEPPTEHRDTIALRALSVERGVRLDQCLGHMDEIRGLGREPDTE